MSEVEFDHTITVTFEVECDTCGQPLDASMNSNYHGDHVLKVEPCPKCLDRRYDEGVSEGEGDTE